MPKTAYFPRGNQLTLYTFSLILVYNKLYLIFRSLEGCDSMKIEKISDNQIRCTLSKQDLTDRELRLSELAYGTEKAKALFRDMIQQASYEFGFEAEDIPLMIEAIPVSSECLVLIITKVEDPDELDTRFSRFSPDRETEEMADNTEDDAAYADEILNCFHQLHEIIDNCMEETVAEAANAEPDMGNTIFEDKSETKEVDFIPLPEAIARKNGTPVKKTAQQASVPANLTKVFSFHSLQDIIQMAEHVVYSYHGKNTVYKDSSCGIYYLVISKSEHSPEEFNKVCNIISEYGKSERATYASPAYYQEHFEAIVKDKAIQVLSTM